MTLYGKQTQAALNNFPISGWEVSSRIIKTLALIKEHAAFVNHQCKRLPSRHSAAIMKAAKSIQQGKYEDQFPVDVFQTGSGTSTNMNVNEVIATLASTKSRKVHPNDHVNLGQSSNDVIPSATQIACVLAVRDDLLPALSQLKKDLDQASQKFHKIIKSGRTHLMDAVPIRLGDEFRAYSALVLLCITQLESAHKKLCTIPLGGTAVGTGINTHPQFAKRIVPRLAKATGLPLKEAKSKTALQFLPLSLLSLSSTLRETATVLSKIANDIRFMGSGPAAGFGELELPELQPGSSLMPGKVNPVLCESVMQVAQYVYGSDTTVHAAVSNASNFELNTAYPVIGHSLLSSIEVLSNVTLVFTEKYIAKLKANEKTIAESMARNSMLVTALALHIGYDQAAKIAKEAQKTGETIVEVAVRRTDIPEKKLRNILDPKRMV